MNDRYKIDDNDSYNWTLSKPLSTYTQEELAKELINYKKNTYDTTIRIGGEYGFALSTAGLNSEEEFLQKYGEILDKANMPKESKNDTNEPREIEVTLKPLSKASISDYTQEEFAHLIMDDKKDGNEYGVRFRGVLFTSVGLDTVEDFINKYQKEFRDFRVKPAVSEEVTFDNSTTDNSNNIIQEAPVEEITTEQLEEPAQLQDISHRELVPILFEIIDNKTNNNQEYEYKYKNTVVSTVECNNYEDIFGKYRELIEKNMEEQTKKALYSNEGKVSEALFGLTRGNLYDGTNPDQQELVSNIREKEQQYRMLIAKKDTLDFTNSKEVLAWLNELTPYINTHALNLNPGVNVSLNGPDKYLLEIMSENGYSSEIIPKNMDSYAKYTITSKLKELEDYGYFVSEYKNLNDEFKSLNSEKTLGLASIRFLERQIEINHYATTKIAFTIDDIKKQCQINIDKIDNELAEFDKTNGLQMDNSFDNMATNDAEAKAINSYKEFSKSLRVDLYEQTVLLINELENEELKDQLLEALNKKAATNLSDEIINKRNEFITRINNVEANANIKIERLEEKSKIYHEELALAESGIAKLKAKYNLDGEEQILPLVQKEDIPEEQVTLEKSGLFGKVKKAFSKKEKVNENVANTVVEENPTVENMVEATEESLSFDLPTEDSLDNFVAIKSFKKITKELYDKLISVNYKQKLQHAIDVLHENRKAVITGASLAVAGIAVGVAMISGISKNNANDNNEAAIELNNEDESEEENILAQDTASGIEDEVVAEVEPVVEEKTIASLEEVSVPNIADASLDAINNIADGNKGIYQSSFDALNEKDELTNAYKASWEGATGGDYYTSNEDGISKISEEEAQKIYANGGKVTQAFVNDGTVIGFANLDNVEQGKTM